MRLANTSLFNGFATFRTAHPENMPRNVENPLSYSATTAPNCIGMRFTKKNRWAKVHKLVLYNEAFEYNINIHTL